MGGGRRRGSWERREEGCNLTPHRVGRALFYSSFFFFFFFFSGEGGGNIKLSVYQQNKSQPHSFLQEQPGVTDDSERATK